MKFVAAVIFTLALSMGVQSSVIPLISQIAGNELSYTAVSGPAVVAPHVAPVSWPAAVSVASWPPAVVAAPAPAVIASPHIIVGEGTYTAKTRGAIHTAPLAGHIKSVASINAAPAPGTI